jgi:hypothetical protein
MNEYELYFPSPQASPWRIVGLLYFFTSHTSCKPAVKIPLDIFVLKTSDLTYQSQGPVAGFVVQCR